MRFLLIVCYLLSIVLLVRYLLAIRREHLLDEHIEQALDLTRPIGPEDEPSWGRR